jgi:phosphosulfolactate synthase
MASTYRQSVSAGCDVVNGAPHGKTPLTLPERQQKPRRRGITAVIDFGPDSFGWTGEQGIADLLHCAAAYIDYVKIYALNALLLPKEVVKRVVRLYIDSGVTPFCGGILFEYAYAKGAVEALVDHLHELEIPGLEISENYLTLTEDQRHREIERFRNHGLSVIYEFGAKNPTEPLSLDRLGHIVTDVVDRGVEHVLVEQFEIDHTAERSPKVLQQLRERPWFERILIEADPYRFPQQHVELITAFGPDINLANVAPGQALRLEGLRRGIGRAVNYSLLQEILADSAGKRDDGSRA